MALRLKAIHGGKNKNGLIDSEKLTQILRSNLIPPAYVYPDRYVPSAPAITRAASAKDQARSIPVVPLRDFLASK